MATIITPQQLWEKYDRLTPPAPVILSSGENGKEQRLYFNGPVCESGTIRVYARLVLPEQQKPPVLIFLCSLKTDIDTVDVSAALNAGYAVLLVDYGGKADLKARHTIYPRGIGTQWENNPAALSEPPADPKTSCWYYFTACVLHAATFLEQCGEIDAGKIGIVGVGEGASLVFKAGYLLNLKAGATFFGGDITGNTPEYLIYKASLDSRAYAKSNFPILINATTNEKNGALDYLDDLYSSSESALFSIFPRADNAVSNEQRKTLRLWFDAHFSGGVIPQKPGLNVFCSEGQMYAEASADCEEVFFYAAEDNAAPYRNWYVVPCCKVAEGKFLAKIEPGDPARTVHVFANATFAGSFTLSTEILRKNPYKLGFKGETVKPMRLLYQSESGAEGWLAQNGGFMSDGAVRVKEGPLGLSGAAGSEFLTYKPGDSRYKASPDSLLQIIMHCRQPQEVEFAITVLEPAPVEFRCIKMISEKDWATVTLHSEYFKSLVGSLTFDKAVSLRIKGRDLIINSVIWV